MIHCITSGVAQQKHLETGCLPTFWRILAKVNFLRINLQVINEILKVTFMIHLIRSGILLPMLSDDLPCRRVDITAILGSIPDGKVMAILISNGNVVNMLSHVIWEHLIKLLQIPLTQHKGVLHLRT